MYFASQGVSDTPAWFVARANAYARHHGKTPFVIFQAAYSVLERDIERDILPMCRYEGIALALWNVLAGGHIRSDAEEERRRQTGEGGRTIMGPWQRTPDEKKMCDALEFVRGQVNAKNITAGAHAILVGHSMNGGLTGVNSGYCVCDAQGAVCLPNCWRSQG